MGPLAEVCIEAGNGSLEDKLRVITRMTPKGDSRKPRLSYVVVVLEGSIVTAYNWCHLEHPPLLPFIKVTQYVAHLAADGENDPISRYVPISMVS